MQCHRIGTSHENRAHRRLRAPRGCHLQHLVKGDFRHSPCAGHDARIGCEHSRHIGVKLAHLGLQSVRQSHCGGVGAAPPQECHIAVVRDALRPCHHGHQAAFQGFAHSVGTDFGDACALVGGIGDEPGLAAGERHRRHIQIVKCQAQQGHGFALAGGDEHVHLSS